MMKLKFGLGMSQALALALAMTSGPTVALAENLLTPQHDHYVPTIWIDPDGCEHWVMDAGQRGFMDIRLSRDGKPYCHRELACNEVPVDQYFNPGSADISADGRRKLLDFFKKNRGSRYDIAGHTDSAGSEASNVTLSQARANAVAAIAKEAGKEVSAVVGFGETKPKASNASAKGKAANRRVEIFCYH